MPSWIDGLFHRHHQRFFDVADVQVLRGPQGTLVGSNSTGGAIFINSKQPDFTGVNGYAEADFGDCSKRGVQGAVNVALGKMFALRGAFNILSVTVTTTTMVPSTTTSLSHALDRDHQVDGRACE